MKIIALALLLFSTACASQQKLTTNNLPKNGASFAVLGFFNERLDGEGKRYFSSRKFSSDIDLGASIRAKKSVEVFLKKENFSALNLNYDQKFFAKNAASSLQDLLQNLKAQNKKLPDYYLLLLPREVEGDVDFGGGSGNVCVVAAEVSWFLIFGLDHKNLKYSDPKIFSKPLYQKLEQQQKSNFKITSVGGLGLKKTACNFAFDLLLIDQKTNQLIAFASASNQKDFDEYLDWKNFDSLGNFSAQEKDKMRENCLKFFDESVDKKLRQIGLKNHR
ncbi:MAG: hypothetical protein KA100_05730 [Rickettsiales bacterium]|nr:hypothetical protein [Rickettsiales bacterium]